MSDLIDLSNVSSTKKSTTTKGKKTMSKTAKSTKKSAAKKSVKKSAKKNVAVTRTKYTEDKINSSVRKAFASWKKGEMSLADVVRTVKANGRNEVWIQFRILAGGTEEALHRLRASGAGVRRGKLRFAPKTAKGKKAKGK